MAVYHYCLQQRDVPHLVQKVVGPRREAMVAHEIGSVVGQHNDERLRIRWINLAGVPDDPEATAIVTAILELARALGMDAVAEGVEDEAQRVFLVQQGCPLAQGFLLGRPVLGQEIEPLLARADQAHAS